MRGWITFQSWLWCSVKRCKGTRVHASQVIRRDWQRCKCSWYPKRECRGRCVGDALPTQYHCITDWRWRWRRRRQYIPPAGEFHWHELGTVCVAAKRWLSRKDRSARDCLTLQIRHCPLANWPFLRAKQGKLNRKPKAVIGFNPSSHWNRLDELSTITTRNKFGSWTKSKNLLTQHLRLSPLSVVINKQPCNTYRTYFGFVRVSDIDTTQTSDNTFKLWTNQFGCCFLTARLNSREHVHNYEEWQMTIMEWW